MAPQQQSFGRRARHPQAVRHATLPFVLALVCFGCGDDQGVRSDSGTSSEGGLDSAGMDGGNSDASGLDAVAPGSDGGSRDGAIGLDSLSGDAGAEGGPIVTPDFPADWPRSRGWDWVRNNEPMVSALTVRMGTPPAEAVRRYYDDFNANTAHTWELGLPTAVDGWMTARPAGRWIAWLDRAGNSVANGTLVGGTPPPGRLGYQVGDEPRTMAALNEILAGLRRVQTADPDGLRILNFTFEAAEVDAFLRTACDSGLVDVFKYDRYTRGNGAYETLALFRDAALACDLPYWRYIKSYIREPGEELQSESDMRWAAFVGLVYGYTGHSWFLYNIDRWEGEHIPSTFFATPNAWDSATTPRFAIAAAINRELQVYGRAQTRLRSTGLGYIAARSIPGLHPPDGAPAWSRGAGGDPVLTSVTTSGGSTFQDLMLGFFEDRYGDTYVMVQNANRSGGSFPNESAAATTATLSFDFAGTSGIRDDRLLVLRPSGSIEPVPVVSGRVEFRIEAGDIVFYKYDTGRPFEGY